jgi:hypothetical protein
MTKRIKALAAGFAILLATTLGLAVSSPAHALVDCNTGLICFFDSYNGGTTPIFKRDPEDRPGCLSLSPNRTSSIDNNTIYLDHDIRVYVNSSSCTGLSTLVYAGTQGNMAGQWDNSIDSMYLY